ncbi:hypothetical protein L211DRAFT_848968 [Terfezia boudieri ATCC MYA-4762]|uniref:Uncharacterized protein n=1 Tax=Terfezia boudieri ATCC MYA-4762 TaxID=1051890 RepID=A0A3N4LMS5_9PEZI|nr:hypothetical protein L211DRAFT_848968 [Terfezia boudieri ATCC MYA-4762]
MATITNEAQMFTSIQEVMSHPATDDINEHSLESPPAYEDVDTLHSLPRAPRTGKRYCALACFNCLLCCIPNCLWSCATSPSQARPELPQLPNDPNVLEIKECSWSCCCIGFNSRKHLYKLGIDPTPGLTVGGKVRPRGQLHARPVENYGGTVNAIDTRPVAVVPQRAHQYRYVRSIDSYRLEEKTKHVIAEHEGSRDSSQHIR